MTMLTAEQLEGRTRTLGASEVPAVVGLSPWTTAVDIWARKRRGPELEVPPLAESDKLGALDADPRALGHALEPAIAELYSQRFGVELAESPTLVHPAAPWRTATPDRLVRAVPTRGLEVKLVGARTAHDWGEDAVPAYVVAQCQWSMHVAALDRWDVAALIGGTELRFAVLERDDEMLDSLVELAEHFWRAYVLADVMPPATTGRDALRALGRLWAEDDGTTVDAPAEAEALAAQLYALEQQAKELEIEIDRHKAALCALVADHAAIKGAWGKYAWPTSQGGPRWKAIAEALAPAGLVPQALIDANRGNAHRRGQLYPSKYLKQGVMT